MNCKVKQVVELSENDYLYPLNIICWDNGLVSLTTWKIVISINFRAWISIFWYFAVFLVFCINGFSLPGSFFWSVLLWIARTFLWTLINQSDKKRVIILIKFSHFWKFHPYFCVYDPLQKFMWSVSQFKDSAGQKYQRYPWNEQKDISRRQRK